jgi:hypothetical protein
MTITARCRVGTVLATLGVLILLVELGLYWLSPLLASATHSIRAAPVLIGCGLGFVGFYMLDHASALEGGRFLVQSAEGILAVVRGGAKRPGDVVLGPATEPPARAPSPSGHLPDPTVTEEHDG